MSDNKQPRAYSRKAKHQLSSQEQSDGEAELSPSQILERVKPDRVTVTKPEEDRRRRTIIVEKSNNSYGFTLQSYGIHYKKEQEIEMITYVDYVEYDGPAYRAGMREGDVILSINGRDMEKTDHKTLVNFIKNCDSRMRMVVLFEDCVRKVELHMRYIQLQRILQNKMSELERLCVKEKELLEGKWKTHSLPARKKGSKATESSSLNDTEESVGYCRPTLSTEDVARATPPPGFGPPLISYRPYQYFDQHGRAYVIHGPLNDSREYIPAWPSGISSRCETKAFARRPSVSSASHGDARGYHQSNGVAAASPANTASSKPPKVKSTRGHHCNPCMQSATSPQDNISLEAYDLASPCCNPQCVPSRRRRHHKPKKSSSIESARGTEWKEKNRCGQSSYSTPTSHHQQSGRKYVSLVSQCSLHSCASNENSTQDKMASNNDSSAASYTTSLSTDTLFWEPTNGGIARQLSVKSNSSQEPLPSVKPKSWDNLTTKGFGGYGFGGYGYVERSQKPQSAKSSRKSSMKQSSQPTKSSESLLLLPADYPGLSDSSLSCECLDSTDKGRFFGTVLGGVENFYHRDKASQTERRVVSVQQCPEITRL